MRWFGLLAFALFLGCADSMNTGPNANSTTTDPGPTGSGTTTTNKPVVDPPMVNPPVNDPLANKPVEERPGTLPPVDRPPDEATRRDNTAVNSRDTESSAKTPLDQGQNSADVSVTADIRKAILAKENMSINARNVKIITENGQVTLRGPVESQAEKDAIDKIAKDRAGAEKVDNYLEIAAGKPE